MSEKLTTASKIFKYNCIEAYISKYMKHYLRCSNTKNSFIMKMRKLIVNYLGYKIGLEIPPNVINETTIIYHENIVINSYAKIGQNVKFHGNNCIGNNGKDLGAPIIGDNVDIGYGAIIIGDVYIANNIIVGANAVVNKSCYEEGVILAGVPAKIVTKHSKEYD